MELSVMPRLCLKVEASYPLDVTDEVALGGPKSELLEYPEEADDEVVDS